MVIIPEVLARMDDRSEFLGLGFEAASAVELLLVLPHTLCLSQGRSGAGAQTKPAGPLAPPATATDSSVTWQMGSDCPVCKGRVPKNSRKKPHLRGPASHPWPRSVWGQWRFAASSDRLSLTNQERGATKDD